MDATDRPVGLLPIFSVLYLQLKVHCQQVGERIVFLKPVLYQKQLKGGLPIPQSMFASMSCVSGSSLATEAVVTFVINHAAKDIESLTFVKLLTLFPLLPR